MKVLWRGGHRSLGDKVAQSGPRVEEEEAEDGGEKLLRKKGIDRPDGRLNRRKDGEGDKVDEDNVQQLEPGLAQNC